MPKAATPATPKPAEAAAPKLAASAPSADSATPAAPKGASADGGKRHTFPGRAVFTPAKAHILDVATVLHDAWSMVPVDFFAGESYSTLSLTICMLRGEARKFDSTMCWLLMHPGRQSAESPPGLPPHAS